MIGFLKKLRSIPCQTDILKRANATTIGIIYLFFAICNIINFFVLLISNKCLALLISDKCLLQNRHNITIDASEHVLIAHDHMLNLFRDFKKALSKVKFGKLLSWIALICIFFLSMITWSLHCRDLLVLVKSFDRNVSLILFAENNAQIRALMIRGADLKIRPLIVNCV